MVDDDECGAVGGMSGRGNGSTRRKPVLVPLTCHLSELLKTKFIVKM
jgi:hypothetical protein